MPVQLPPRRPLSDPDRMLREILATQQPERSNRSHRRAVVGALLVAAAAVSITAVAVPTILHDDDTIAASPSVAVPSAGNPTPITRSTPPHPTTGRLTLGETANLDHVTVTVSRVEHSPSFGILVYAEVCVRSLPPGSTGDTTRLSWNSWRVFTGEGEAAASLRTGPPGATPPSPVFPEQADLAVGQCARGYVPFNADEHSEVIGVRYADPSGDVAVWAGS